MVGNKGAPLISRTHPKFSEQGCKGWTVMDGDDPTGQGGLGLSPLPKYSCLLTLSPSLQERIMLDAFPSCFARRVLDVEIPAYAPLRWVIRVMGRSLDKGYGLVAPHPHRALLGL